MALVVALQDPPDEREHLIEGHVLRMGHDCGRDTAQVPEEPLFGNPFRHPRQQPILHGPVGADLPVAAGLAVGPDPPFSVAAAC